MDRDWLDRLARWAADTHPEECCGLLYGSPDRIEAAEPTDNVDPQPLSRFEIDPLRLIGAKRAARDGGPAIVGYFHSHPNGIPKPSRTDAEMAAPDGRLWLVIAGTDAAAWRAVEQGALHGRFDPVDLVVEDSGLAPGRADRH